MTFCFRASTGNISQAENDFVVSCAILKNKSVIYIIVEVTKLKKGNYGLDAPAAVAGYLIAGVLFAIFGVAFCKKYYYAGWLINLGILLVLIGLYMVYGSKIGKYKMREEIVENLSIKGNEIALDVGCGRGLVLNGVASKITSGKVYGVDIWNGKDQSGNTYDAVMKNAEIEGTRAKIEVVNSDMRTLPFQDGYFDLIVSSLAVHNLPSKQDREKALFEMARVMQSGGRIALLDLAHIDDYAAALKSKGFVIDKISNNKFCIFPPIKVLYATKKEWPVR